jgi:hypothetical protein
MKPALSLALIVCASFAGSIPVAAAPVVSITPTEVVATVPPGHRVAWITAYTRSQTGFAADTDGDGRIQLLATTSSARWIVVDVDNGEWTTAGGSISISPPGPGSILQSTDGSWSQLVIPPEHYSAAGSVLWIRPGVGAWHNGYDLGGPGAAHTNAGSLYPTGSLYRLGSAPALPLGFEDGDLLFILSSAGAVAGVVDDALNAAPTPGSFWFPRFETISVREGSEVAFRIVRLGGTAGTVTVRCAVVPSTAEPGLDFVSSDFFEVTFGPGETVKPARIQTIDGADYTDFTRTLRVRMADASGGATLGNPTERASATITENDPAPVVTWGAYPASVVEGDREWAVNVPWSLTGPFRGSLTVQFSSTNGPHTSHVVTPGDTQRSSLVTIYGDLVQSLDRKVHFLASGPAGRSASGEILVTNDDHPQVVIGDLTVREGEHAAMLTIQLTRIPMERSNNVSWTTVDGTARAGTDYTARSGTVEVYGSGNIIVPLLGDSAAEDTETFYVDITGVTGSILPPAATRIAITILDEDAVAPPVTLVVPSVVEGTTGEQTHTVVVEVKLAQASQSIVKLDMNAVGGTASSPADFTAGTTTLTFEPGTVKKSYPFMIFKDSVPEPDETVIVNGSQNGVVRATATLTIVDDDAASFVTVSSPTVSENSDATFVVTFSPPAASNGTVDYATFDQTATAGADYTPTSGKLAFSKGQTSLEIRVPVLDDSLTEPAETFRLQLANITGTGMVLQQDRGVATIRASDSTTTSVTLSATSVAEGHTGQTTVPVLVQLAGPLTAPITLTIETTGRGSASPNSDFSPLLQVLTFQAGEWSKQVSLIVHADTTVEPDESLEVTATHDGRVVATLQLSILDDDGPISVSVADAHVVEGTNGAVLANFAITFSRPPAVSGTIDYITINGTATAGADFKAASGFLAFTAGQQALNVPIEVFGDAIPESTEQFGLRLSNITGPNASFADDRADGTITDDDIVLPALSVADIEVREGNAPTEALFSLRLSAASERPVTAAFFTRNETAETPSDYEYRSGAITFAPGQTTHAVVIPISGDQAVEATEAFTLHLTGVQGAVAADAVATCTIVDDDAPSKRRTVRH